MLVLADVSGLGDMHPQHRLWAHVEGWAAELGVSGSDVLARTASAPTWMDAGRSALSADPEAGG